MHRARWYLFFLNKYFIISTIIWCYAVYSDSHQNMMTEKSEKISANFYNHMQLHNLFYYNNMMFRARAGQDWGRVDLWILKCKYTFCAIGCLGDIFWSFTELNKRLGERAREGEAHIGFN